MISFSPREVFPLQEDFNPESLFPDEDIKRRSTSSSLSSLPKFSLLYSMLSLIITVYYFYYLLFSKFHTIFFIFLSIATLTLSNKENSLGDFIRLLGYFFSLVLYNLIDSLRKSQLFSSFISFFQNLYQIIIKIDDRFIIRKYLFLIYSKLIEM